MRIALFSDIHANLPALEAVLEDIDAQKPDAVFCLGDLVGYATWPNEVVSAIRSRSIPTIAGNYDEGVGLNSDDCGCAYKTDEDRERGAQSIGWTNRAIADENRQWLNGLPRHIRVEYGSQTEPFTLLMVHGSPRKINEYLFEDRPENSFTRMMNESHADAMFFGHTHKPFYKRIESQGENGEPRYRHAINIGSVGKPKDGDPTACYVLLHVNDTPTANNPDAIRPEFIRVAYDVERAARAIEASELPSAFAEMLRTGK